MSRFDDNRSLNPVQTDLQNEKMYTPRSAANLSNTRFYKMKVGAIAPIRWIETLPNSDYEIQVSNLVKLAVPMARQFYGSFRVYTHVYYQENHCLWEGSDIHYTNGRSGMGTKVNGVYQQVRKPTLRAGFSSNVNSCSTSHMNSPLDYMALPFLFYSSDTDKYINTNPLPAVTSRVQLPNGVVNRTVSALPFVMYHNICRDYYSPQNLVQNNKLLFPDNPNDMILPFDANGQDVTFMIRSAESYNSTRVVQSRSDWGYFSGNEDDYGDIVLNILRYRSYKGDYFTTASPFPNLLRGNIPTMELTSTTGTLDWSDVFSTSNPSEFQTSVEFKYLSAGYTGNGSSESDYSIRETLGMSPDHLNALKKSFSRARINSVLNAQINLNQLRQLEAITIFRERMARTSGDYNEMIQAQGLGNPHHEHNRPKYCGGSYQDLVFSDVTSTVSTTSEGYNPLGTKVSQAMSSASGDVIRVHSSDYGNIMICVSVVPETVYSQGIDRCWTKLDNVDEYFPILQNLAPQPILNKEIYFTNSDSDNQLFGYTERFSEYKSARNSVSGAFALADVEMRKSVAQRKFTSLPTLSPSFLSLSTFDYSIFSNSLEMPFDFITNISCRAVQPISYTTQPGGLQARG